MVLDEVIPNPTKEIALEAFYFGAPSDRCDAHQMRLAAAGRATVEHLGRWGLKGQPLLRM
jgi:hypothetical protein